MIKKNFVSVIQSTKKFVGLYEVCGHHFLGDLLDVNSIVIDLGANKGEFSTSLTKKTNCCCHAVEPSPRIFFQIPNNASVIKHHIAIGHRDDEIDFFVRSDSESSSVKLIPSMEGKVERVKQMTLNSFIQTNHIQKIDLLKIDIEGAEVELFDAMSDEMFQNINQITIEFHDFIPSLNLTDKVSQIRRRLKGNGYREYLFSPNFHMDCLYIHCKCKISVLTRVALRLLDCVIRLRKVRLKMLSKLGIRNLNAA